MKVILLVVGKTDEQYLKEAIYKYKRRLKRYIKFDIQVIPDIKSTKNISCEEQKKLEGKRIIPYNKIGNELHLLDEQGTMFSSIEFAEFLQKKMLAGIKELVFVIGGPYGFSEEVYRASNSKISLSKMTFSHQLARLLFTEQFYRALTIIKGEPYHHK